MNDEDKLRKALMVRKTEAKTRMFFAMTYLMMIGIVICVGLLYPTIFDDAYYNDTSAIIRKESPFVVDMSNKGFEYYLFTEDNYYFKVDLETYNSLSVGDVINITTHNGSTYFKYKNKLFYQRS